MDYVYKFPVVRGIQAKREYFIAMVPLKMLPRLFPIDDEYVLPEYRAQRKLNEARIPVISKYILDNRDSYVFSALAEYYGAAEPPVRCGVSHLSGLTEPPQFVY